MTGKMDRTMGGIAARYDARREEILRAIHAGKVSASMSGIEYYPKPWAELDVTSLDGDLTIISVALSWNGQRHDLELSPK